MALSTACAASIDEKPTPNKETNNKAVSSLIRIEKLQRNYVITPTLAEVYITTPNKIKQNNEIGQQPKERHQARNPFKNQRTRGAGRACIAAQEGQQEAAQTAKQLRGKLLGRYSTPLPGRRRGETDNDQAAKKFSCVRTDAPANAGKG